MSISYYLRDVSGQRTDIVLTERIGAIGSQGSVWQVDGRPTIAVKLVHRPGLPGLATRLPVMLSLPQGWCVRGGEVTVTWPLGAVHQRQDDSLAGFYMPRLASRRFAASVGLFDTARRNRLLPGHTWDWVLRFACALADQVSRTHSRGFVIGDLAPENIYFTPSAGVCLIDVDGWQITPDPAAAPLWCPFSRGEYTAPEISPASPSLRSPSSDWWSLAVLIGQLLFLGFHPFGGVPNTRQRVLDEAGNMRDRRIFICGDDVWVPPGTAPLWLLPPRLRIMFRRAFVDGYDEPAQRPDPLEWLAELTRLRRELVVCAANPRHSYSREVAKCPWCLVSRIRGADPFK